MPKLLGLSLSAWIVLAVILAGVIILSLLSRSRKQWSVRVLTTGSLCVALGFILSFAFFKIRMPFGGSITPGSMVPVMLFAYLYGPLPGLGAGVVHGLLQLLEDAYVIHPAQLLLDYIIAFACMALAGVFKKSFPAGVLLASVCRFICHCLSGLVFFSGEAVEAGLAPWLYTLQYNASYMGAELVLCIVLAVVLSVSGALKALQKQKSIGRI